MIQQHIHGKLLSSSNPKEDGRRALLLLDAAPESKTADSLYLSFALLVRGPEDHILPALLKDDWGNERHGLDIYGWIEDEGNYFPRTELFGYDVDGTQAQCFLRAIELYAKLPCYLFMAKNRPVTEGIRLQAILLPDESAETVQKVKRPSTLQRPLRSAAVSWWQVPPTIATFDLLPPAVHSA